MCRHAAYVGPPLGLGAFLDRPAHGLVEQSYHPREMLTAELNADGFGFGWYRESGAAGVYTNSMPIWSDINLAHIGRAFESRLWLGNVRSATPGQPVNQANTHPFLAGNLLFSHNGFIHDFEKFAYLTRRSPPLTEVQTSPWGNRLPLFVTSTSLIVFFHHCRLT